MAWYDILDRIFGGTGSRLKLFADEQRRWRADAQYQRGLRVIEVDNIIGTVDRNRSLELDSNFQYRNGSEPYRLRRILRALSEGVILPPIEVNQIKDEYFVIDGHHRVAAAKQNGQIYIDANVHEYLPDKTDPANTLFYERRNWKKETGLRDIRVTEPGLYAKLLNRINDFKKECEAAGLPPYQNLREAAADWYRREYLPVAAQIEQHHILDRFPERTLSDIFVYIMDHRWLESKRLGKDIGMQQSVDDFINDFGHTTLNERLVQPIVRLGTNLLERAHDDKHPLPVLRWLPRDWEDEFVAGLVVGLLALPWVVLNRLWQRRLSSQLRIRL